MRIASRIPPDFAELDVDPVRDLRASLDVGERVAVLVDVDRDRRARLQLAPAGVAGAQRLLAVLDADLGELRERVERLLERPPLVHVDHEREVGDAADGADALDVEAVAAAELELEPAVRRARPSPRACAMSSGSPSQIVQEVGGPVLGSPRSRNVGIAQELSLEVVQRGVERRLRRLLAWSSGEALADVLERERVVADERAVIVDEAHGRLRRLVVALDRRRLAVPGRRPRASARPGRRRRSPPPRAR